MIIINEEASWYLPQGLSLCLLILDYYDYDYYYRSLSPLNIMAMKVANVKLGFKIVNCGRSENVTWWSSCFIVV